MEWDEMLVRARKAMANAYAPYSQFKVGCCLQSPNGRLFEGTNVENAAYGSTHCAETSAIGALITQGETRIAAVLIVSHDSPHCSPCGNCRQKIAEFASPETPIHICNETGLVKSYTLSELLPHPFAIPASL